MSATILAGDVGGTKCNLGLYRFDDPRELHLIRQDTFNSKDFPKLEDVINAFLGKAAPTVDACAVGVAGPVMDGVGSSPSCCRSSSTAAFWRPSKPSSPSKSS